MASGWPAVRALRAVRAARELRLVRAAAAAGDLVVVDVETTGWQPGEAALTEVGAVRVRDGQVTASSASWSTRACRFPAGSLS